MKPNEANGGQGTPSTHGGDKDRDEDGCHGGYVAVAVYTPQGCFPGEDDYRKTPVNQPIEEILKVASAHFKLTNTSDWVATVDDKEIPLSRTYADLKPCCFVEIDWHKREGGGGA